jgi:CRISPR/Cas system-associated exonuclease Cas4 (RecB family)
MLIVSGKMGLRTQKPSSAKHDLAKLSRVLGVQTPVAGPSDGIVTLAGGGARCRVRVLDAAGFAAAETPFVAADAAILLAPVAGPVTVAPEVRAAPQRMSYTQFSEFEHCPRRFWIRRVMGVRAIGVEHGAESDPLRFGTALHAALRLVSAAGEAPEVERISAIGRFFELGADGVRRLGEAVERYCGSDVAAQVASRPSVRRESPFSMRIGESFLLTGAIDLYARDGDDALIVDYKSGVTGEGAELGERYRLQARCYALAVLRDGCTTATIQFVRPEVETAGGTIQRTTFTFAAAEACEIEQDLLRRYAEIEASAFEPSASHDCLHCDIPAGLCSHQGRAADGVGARSAAS